MELKAVLQGFIGETEQVPPPFSAKKIKGVPAYKLARKDKEVVLTPVRVKIDSLDLLEWRPPEAKIRVTVSSGTYIRSIAHEAGQKLGCGAHLSQLRRMASGEFTLAEAVGLEKLTTEEVDDHLLNPMKILTALPAVVATTEQAGKLRQGIAANLPEFSQKPLIKVLFEGQIVAVCRRVAGTLFQPRTVLG